MRLNRNARTLLAVIIILLGLYLLSGGRVEAGDDKVTICHATSSETKPYETITVSTNAAYGPGGHFNENGTTQAGHEEDYFGPCNTPTASPSTPTSGASPTPVPTPTFTSTAAPSATPTITPTPRPTPVTSGMPTPTASTSPATTSQQPTSATLPPSDAGSASEPAAVGFGALWVTLVTFTLAAIATYSIFAARRRNR